MKNEMITQDKKYYDDRIDLVDLIKILIRNKSLIIMTTIIITIFSVGGALYIKSNKIEKLNQNFTLKDYKDENGELIVPNLNVETLLYNDEVIDEFYRNEKLNSYFNKSNDENSYLSKRKFLEKITDIKVDDKNPEITLTTEIKDDKKFSLEMIDLYLDILNKQRINQITKNLGEEKSLELKVAEYNKKLEVTKNKINEYIAQLPEATTKNQSILELVELNRPILIKQQRALEDYYDEYYKKLLLLKNIKNEENQIVKTSSVYVNEEKSKTLMIIAIGMILGLFLGIFAAFMKEFVKEIDWEEKK